MPFTFSHPAFALPLAKFWPRYFSATGLFFGSIAPDCHMYFTMDVFPLLDNNVYAILRLFIPVAIVLSLFFHLVVRNNIITHLPAPYDAQYAQYLNFDFVAYLKKHYFAFLFSVFIAICVHLFLDNFTHYRTTFNLHFPTFITTQIALPVIGNVWVYNLFQIALSVIGFVAGGYIFSNIKSHNVNYTPIATANKIRYYFQLSLIIVFITIVRMQFPVSGHVYNDIVVISIMSSLMIAVSLIALAYYFFNKYPGKAR